MQRCPAACLALAAAFLGACTTEVRLAPSASDWTVAGDKATWTGGGVDVVASLLTSEGKFPIQGEIRSTSPFEAAFVPIVSSEGGDVGETRASADPQARAERFAAGEFVAPPPGAPTGETVLAFRVRPDVAWRSLPVVGSTITYSVVVRTAEGDVTCPFRFRVDVSETEVSTLGKLGMGAGAALLLGAIVVGASGYFVVTSF